MKILNIINVPNTRTGGPARQMYALQMETARRGHSMDLLFSEDAPGRLGWSGLGGVLYPFLVPWMVQRASRRGGPYDLVQIHTTEALAYVWLRRWCRKWPPCVVISHGADELRWFLELEEARLGFRPLGWRARFLYYNLVVRGSRCATRYADHVITMSSAEKTFFQERYRMDPGRISLIPNGVSLEFFCSRDYARPCRRLLYVGGWEWRKGVRYLREAFSQVAERVPDITLSIVGTWGASSIAKEFPPAVRHRISVIPSVDPKETPPLYADHDLFVLPTLFESIPLVIPEAMASGMPIVSTRVCGIPDILEKGTSALLVPPRNAPQLAQALEQLLRDPSLRERLGRAAQERARTLTWDHIAQQTLDTYRKLTDGSIDGSSDRI